MSTSPAPHPPGKALDYALVDVFAERPLEGNQLAIFTDARGLSTEQMQALAREMNLAETTFILPDDPEHERVHGVRVRIFTTQEELPFAGHPTLGTASWLFWNHPTLAGSEAILLKLNSCTVPVRFRIRAAADQVASRPSQQPPERGIFATMRQNDAAFGNVHSPEQVAGVLDLSIHDLDPALPIQTVSTGMPFCIVPVRSMEAMQRLAIPQASAQRWLDTVGAKFFFCVTPAVPGSGVHFHNRMQFYSGEDPATGSASGCAIAWLVRHGVVPSGRPTVFEQGVEIRRPSRIHVQASLRGEGQHAVVTDIMVGGRTILVASGRFLRA